MPNTSFGLNIVIPKLLFVMSNVAKFYINFNFSIIALCMFVSSTLIMANPKISSVTVGNSPTATGTLGSYQPLNWARLAGLRTHAGVNTTERSHFYHLYTTFIEISNIRVVHHSTWFTIWLYNTSLFQITQGVHHLYFFYFFLGLEAHDWLVWNFNYC